MSKVGSSMKDRIKNRAETRATHGGGGNRLNVPEGVNFFKPKKGTMTLDILPYRVSIPNHPEGVKVGELWFQRTIFVHYGIGAEEKAYLCPKTLKKPCAVCEERGRLQKVADDADEEIIGKLRPRERELYNVYDYDDADKGIQLWEYSYALFGKKLEEELREGHEANSAFAELKHGKTLKVRFQEEKIGKTSFLEATRIDFEDREDYDESILDQTTDLDSILNVPDYKTLQQAFLGIEGETAETTETAEPAPAPVRPIARAPVKPAAPARRPAAPPPPVDEPDSPPEDEQTAPPPPARRPAATTTAPLRRVPARPAAPPPVEEVPEDLPPDEAGEPEAGDEDQVVCKACAGKGTNSKGKPCYPCDGTGYIAVKPAEDQFADGEQPASDEVPPDDAVEEPAPPPARRPATKPAPAAPAAKGGVQMRRRTI